jgi:ribosomal protein S18 acetylase RimI-like enzyme
MKLDRPGESKTWVADQGNIVTGFVHLGPTRDDEGDPARTGELYGMYVDPDHTGDGLGKELMDTAMAFFSTGPWSEATLWVLKGNGPGRSFYEALGWETEGTIKTVTSITGHTMEHIRYRIDLPAGDA